MKFLDTYLMTPSVRHADVSLLLPLPLTTLIDLTPQTF
jgi:hypothetical protein